MRKRKDGAVQKKRGFFAGAVKGICMALLLGMAAGTGFFVSNPAENMVAEAATRRKLVELYAEYTGEPVMVGETVKKREIQVTGWYDDGTDAVIRTFTLASDRINRDGDNILTITYNGLRTTVIVPGKKVESLEVDYRGEDVVIGNAVKKKEIYVLAYFTDGSTEEITNFTLTSDVIRREGENTVIVSFGGKRAEVIVYGKQPLAVVEIEAYYDGEGVIVGNTPNKNDIHVIAYYNDETVEPKEVTGYTMSPAKISKVGTNRVTVTFESKSTVMEVEGLPKEVERINAVYMGGPLEVGKRVDAKNIQVTAIYNDGSKEITTEFRIESPVIYEEGANEIVVECGDVEDTIIVRGVRNTVVDYGNAVTATIGEDKDAAKVTVAVPYGYDKKDITMTPMKKNFVKAAMKRAVKSSDYMAFEIELSDELECELPMAVKVKLPENYEKDRFAVYYTTNGKTIVAKMNGEFLDDSTYEFYMFQQGVYVFVNALKDGEEAPEIEDDEEDTKTDGKDGNTTGGLVTSIEVAGIEKEELHLKVGETYQLQVTVLPENAANKKLLYTSSRAKYLTISETGLLTGIKEGASLVTLTALDESGVTKEILVYVEK